MVNNIPSREDFSDLGTEYLMLAFTGIFGILLKIEEADADDEILEETEFWDKARTKMYNFASLIHQGQDFILKSKICEISPFLLFDNNPDKYPKQLATGRDFADFHSHDSSKLLKIVNTFSAVPLSDEFTNCFEKCRVRRNKLMHTFSGDLRLQAEDLIKDTLLTTYHLLSVPWLDLRKEYIGNDEEAALYGEYILEELVLMREFSYVYDLLTNVEKRHI